MKSLALSCVLLAAAGVASATPSYIVTANGTAGGVAIDAEADFTFTNTTLTLTLTNLLVNPTSVAQNISDFEFTVAALSGTPTLAPYPATQAPQLVIVNAPDFSVSNTNSTTGPPGWTFDYAAGTFALNGLGSAVHTPAYTIVGAPGAGGYTNANGSFGGPHNPFIYQTATWVFNIVNPGGLPLSVTNINFSFGTTPGDNYTCGAPGQVCSYTTPEPNSMILMGTGLVALAFFARRAASKKTA